MDNVFTGTVYKGLDIVCTDKNGTSHSIFCSDYDENIDEIKIRTEIKK